MLEMHEFLALVWYLLLGLMLVFYVVADGFDLGVGILSLLNTDLTERQKMMGTLHGVWDASETWLILFGGALFGAFPRAYTDLLHTLYVPMMVMLLGLIARGLAFEFSATGRRIWNRLFGLGSLLAALSQGLMLGAVIGGLANDAGDIVFTREAWLNPFSLVVAVGVVAGYVMLGAAYLNIRTRGVLQGRSRRWCRRAAWVTFPVVATVTVVTPLVHTYIAQRWFASGHLIFLFILPVVALFMYRGLFVSLRGKKDYQPFVWVVLIFTVSFAGLAISLYPYLIPPAVSIFTASSSSATLVFMLVGVGMLMPVILIFNAYQYLTLHGQTQSSATMSE